MTYKRQKPVYIRLFVLNELIDFYSADWIAREAKRAKSCRMNPETIISARDALLEVAKWLRQQSTAVNV